ncbi:hypothetical protein E0H26_04000 [Micromonospora zingiberis]|uniref:Uncharacterized protein n=1 Tax=Micromonospora zingiberis TaxID=2053011 RepID=A0A4R0GS80_9ACTN|nr:DUF6153 family protein [Micromonospora zingiberis]TCB99722.1 hypothetical protein E0H26_04000 [Micromonospora zingiberis]
MRGDAATTGRWVRTVLLACTLFGLATMHSLGHDPMIGAAGHGSHAEAVPACADGHCTALAAPASEQPGHGDGAGWGVCLAIAAGFALTVVLAVLLLRGTRGGRPRGRTPTPPAGGRAPPVFAPIGLTTASVSVLRI